MVTRVYEGPSSLWKRVEISVGILSVLVEWMFNETKEEVYGHAMEYLEIEREREGLNEERAVCYGGSQNSQR